MGQLQESDIQKAGLQVQKSEWAKAYGQFRRNPTAVASFLFLVLMVLVAIFAPYLAPHDPIEPDYNALLSPPTATYPFGTDNLGRDVLSRVIYGSRISLQVGMIAVTISLIVGSLMGIIAGYSGGWLDNVIMRAVDVMMAIPSLILALIIIATLGPSLANVMIAIGISSSPVYARLMRGSVLSVKETGFVEAARAMGCSDAHIIGRHILPNIMAPLIVYTTLRVGVAILSAAGLSFIGLGAQPPTPEWGAMLSVARNYLREAWWMATFPGLGIVFTVLSINLLGDALRDILDPKLNR
jgi:peptide/nickel transport system permease protein